MKALILNSGIGKRMGSLTADRCKCMAELAEGVTILDRQLVSLTQCGIDNVCITTGPFAEDIESYVRQKYKNIHFTFVHNPLYSKTNYIYSIFLAKDLLQNDDILLLHGDIVFELSVLRDLLDSEKSAMITDSAKPLPEKDFKAVVQNNKIIRIGIDEFDEAYYAQPMYKLLKNDWLIWLNEICRFCDEGIVDVYAENAFNCVSGKMDTSSLDIKGRICFEVDNQSDLSYANEIYGVMIKKNQNLFSGYSSYLKIKEISAIAKPNKVMVVCDSGFEKLSLPVKTLLESIPGDIIYFKDFSPNPNFEDIIKGVSLFIRESCDFIVSIGGGSAIDTAKCINILAEDNSLMLLKTARCQHLAIPTTAGTGSESTPFAVLYHGGKKHSIEHESILPEYVILEPGFLETLPEYQKKSTMLDALCQSIESIWAKGATVESKEYAAKAIRIIMENVDGYLEGSSESMDFMLQAANLSGKAIAISKTTAAHAMSYKLSDMFGIAHGHAVSMCLPYVWEHLLGRQQECGAINNSLGDLIRVIPAKNHEDACALITGIIHKMNINHELNYSEEDIDRLAKSVNAQRLSNHPVSLSYEELHGLYKSILKTSKKTERQVKMKAESLIEYIKELGIEVIAGVPDSTLKEFCDYINSEETGLKHYTVPDEGGAVGIASGVYLATGKPACVYMQNSGIGNTVNPITSIVNEEVYNIPMLFVVGYRGTPDKKDEPQHKFMGRITEKIFDCLEIDYEVIDRSVTEPELEKIFRKAKELLDKKKQFALIIKRDSFEKRGGNAYSNSNTLEREYVIAELIKRINANDLIISSTGKISREVYEQSDLILNHHKQCFLTVGGMGYASMIAFGVAQSLNSRRVICLDGDGAVLMHMGNLAFIGEQNVQNIIHICLNNSTHESVGGMPTAAQDISFAKLAKACGYTDVFTVRSPDELNDFISSISGINGLVFAEIKVANTSRDDLGRPRESASDNAAHFMRYIKTEDMEIPKGDG